METVNGKSVEEFKIINITSHLISPLTGFRLFSEETKKCYEDYVFSYFETHGIPEDIINFEFLSKLMTIMNLQKK